jgi:hypothetical protein
MDFLSERLNLILYRFGISTDPSQTVIGYDGWFYLGDKYAETITAGRRGETPADVESGKQIGLAMEAWDHWLAKKGVSVFRVMVGPDKGTIYPEFLPTWARPTSSSATDALLAGTGSVRYVDLRKPLRAARSETSRLLYYATDSHWNSFGAGLGFIEFGKNVVRAAPEISWPTEEDLQVTQVLQRPGGDLARFLHISKHLADPEPVIKIQELPIDTAQFDFDTGQLLRQGGNPAIDFKLKPVLVESEHALNKKRVLWLRDSFGTGMSSMMAATFSEVVQIHWIEALKLGGRFAELVDKFKPDLVFITVVEREARTRPFTLFPPLAIRDIQLGFSPARAAKSIALHDLESKGSRRYRITGADPFVDYTLENPIRTSDAPLLKIKLQCANDIGTIPMQVFWLEDDASGYSEARSVNFTLDQGERLLDLRTAKGWNDEQSVKRLRIDIDSQDYGSKRCSEFELADPVLGFAPNQ